MAREPIELECTECGRRNYSTTKNTHKKREKLEVQKFCKQCRKHTKHKEVK
ncbi:MAG: 50S ribosomal protein L33 [Candidatus Calescibacterium sp.]